MKPTNPLHSIFDSAADTYDCWYDTPEEALFLGKKLNACASLVMIIQIAGWKWALARAVSLRLSASPRPSTFHHQWRSRLPVVVYIYALDNLNSRLFQSRCLTERSWR
jgi:hypothetical protein